MAGHRVNYLAVFGALCVFTALSVVADFMSIPNKLLLIVIVLAIASAKALCVMAWFMHLKFEGNWKYVLLAPTTILAIGIPLALLPDVGVHYYGVSAPQEQQLRSALKAAVASEDKANPRTDEELRELLKNEHQYDVTVQKVAEYRKALNIPSPDERKRE